ncbi:MAG: hypothetical protein ACR2PL_07225 [Dehalococcoidia bacterium]
MVDIEDLRLEVLEAVRQVFSKYGPLMDRPDGHFGDGVSKEQPLPANVSGTGDVDPIVEVEEEWVVWNVPEEEIKGWEHKGTDGAVSWFAQTRAHSISHSGRKLRFLLVRGQQDGPERNMNRVIVLFRLGKENSNTYRTISSFDLTKDGRFAALIPNPARPSSNLKDGDTLPVRFHGACIERTDSVLDRRVGPTLRVVLDGGDELGMVLHGWWVARTRSLI